MRKKRFEIMTQEDIMKAYNTPYTHSGKPTTEAEKAKCNGCCIKEHDALFGTCTDCNKSGDVLCSDIVRNYLTTNIDVKKRWETIKSDEDVEKLSAVYNTFYKDSNEKSLAEFLCEWVETGRELEKKGH